MDPERVLACYAGGVEAVATIAEEIADWGAPTPCEAWRAADLAAHLRTTAERFALVLAHARAGAPVPVVRGAELARLNDEMIDAAPRAAPRAHVAAFVEAARRYAEVLGEAWEVRPFMAGWDCSAGEHAGVAAGEWHVHAWDLARAAGRGHTPADPGAIAEAYRTTLTWLPLAPGDPWRSVLRAQGRDPG